MNDKREIIFNNKKYFIYRISMPMSLYFYTNVGLQEDHKTIGSTLNTILCYVYLSTKNISEVKQINFLITEKQVLTDNFNLVLKGCLYRPKLYKDFSVINFNHIRLTNYKINSIRDIKTISSFNVNKDENIKLRKKLKNIIENEIL